MQLNEEKLYQGNTWNWSEQLADYDPTDYTLTLYLKLGTGDTISKEAAEDDEDATKHEFTYAAAATTNYTSGVYDYEFTVTKKSDSTVTSIDRGTVPVLPSLSASTDERTHYEKVLDALTSVIESRATREQGEITLPGGTAIKYLTPAELRTEYAYYKIMVKEERRRQNGQPSSTTHKIKFT